MKLYFSPGSCGLASQIALREAGQDFELIRVDFGTKRTIEGDYYQVTPKGFVPVLKLDDGQILTEGAVILQWIADRFPAKQLLPSLDTMARYRAMEWLNYVATDLHKGMAVMFSPLVDPESKTRFAEGNLASRFDYVNEHLASQPYLLGDTFSVADGYLFNVLSWAPRVNIDLSGYTAIQAFMARMKERPSVRASLDAEGVTLA
ncbi:glutathione transferase GstA [Luteibacter aegosomaticola]|uniref:glutathione transferase GstA n=1 Tax=Luteibacter aegosomaticola TaxID=2911538 RepID=UPI001FF89C4F|nr:glutathione transferase GstA [Luteibacter aegosomaticola]UPG89983.1 glutathione transferase GstA [Luteibacter aegosomaticola]